MLVPFKAVQQAGQQQPRLEEKVNQQPSGEQGVNASGAQQQHLPDPPKGSNPVAPAPEVAPTLVSPSLEEDS